jgi:hypothetical protein
MKNTQEIQEWEKEFDEKFCSLYGNKVYAYDKNKGKHILLNSENDAEQIKSFISQKLKEQEEKHKREIESILVACQDKDGLIDKDLCVREGVAKILNILSKYPLQNK